MGSPKPLRLSEYKSTIKALNIFIMYTFKLIKLVSFETQNDDQRLNQTVSICLCRP